MAAPTSFLNAKLVEDRVQFLYRDDQNVLKTKSFPAEWITYHPRMMRPGDDVTSAAMRRALRNDRRVLGVTQEGDYLRVRWKGKWERRDVCNAMRKAATPVPVNEGDVSPIKRLVSDLGLGIAKPRRLFFDIETDSRVNFARSRKGEARVLSWAAIDEADNEFTAVLEEWSDEAEKALLDAFWALAEKGVVHRCVEVTRDEGAMLLKKRGAKLADSTYDLDHGGPLSQVLHEVEHGYDQLLAWAGRHGDETYDFQVIEKRSATVGAMPKDMQRWLWLDHHDVFERMNKNAAESGDEKQSLKLHDVGMKLVGEGKDDFDPSKTYEAWAAGGAERLRLIKYNLKDVRLMIKIEAKSGYIEVFQALCEACGIFPNTYALYPTVQMDGFMLRLGAKRNLHFKTRYWDKEEDLHPREQFEGAFVLHPKIRGIVENVHVGDFASMYPSIIITFNMSPETKLGIFPEDERPPNSCYCPGTGVCFSTTTQGILAYAVNEMLRLRAYWKDKQAALPPGTPEWVDAGRRSTAYKVAANSFFGAMGNQYSRYYDEEIAESITTTGAWLAKRVIAKAERKWGIEAIYGDTDALMARGTTRKKFVRFTDYCNDKLFPRLLAKLGCTERRIKIDNEKGFKRIVFMLKSGSKTVLAAKKYVGVYSYYKGTKADANSEPEIKGLAYRRGDTNSMARDLQWDIIQHFADAKKYVDKASYVQTVLGWKKKVLEEKLSVDEVMVTAQLVKELDDYVVRKKKNGEDAAQPPHVRVGKILRSRGAEAMLGTRVQYFMKDHATRNVLPAEDYDGTVDRPYLWEDKVYKPSQSLLEAIFPNDDWKELKRARPKKERKGRKKNDAGGAGSDRSSTRVEPSGEKVVGDSGRTNAGVPTDGKGVRRIGEETSRTSKPSRVIRTAHESFICGVCADEVEIGDEFRGFECAECGSGGAAHVFPCTKKGAICWACKDKKEIPIRKKRKVALS